LPAGYILGYNKTSVTTNSDFLITVDHGYNDTGGNSPGAFDEYLPRQLSETQFLIKMDYRLGRLLVPKTDPGQELAPISKDDDYMATYLITTSPQNAFASAFFQSVPMKETSSPIGGSRGWRTIFGIGAASNINIAGTAIWTELGSIETSFFGADSAHVIRTSINVEGVNTNLDISIPITFAKKV